MESDGPSLDTLLDICLRAAAGGDAWRRQRHSLKRLPEHAANALLRQLLQQRKLAAAPQLEMFRHSASQLEITGAMRFPVNAEWMAYIADMRFLERLALTRVLGLKDKALAALPRLALTLRSLSLEGCSGVRGGCVEAVAQLTRLTSLNLSGTAVKGAELQPLTALTALCSLSLSHLHVRDADLAHLLPPLTRLEALALAATAVGDAALPCIADLAALTSLDLSWTRARSLPALPALRVLSMATCELADSLLAAEAVGDASAAQLPLAELNLEGATLQPEAAAALAWVLGRAPQLEVLRLMHVRMPDEAVGLEALPLTGRRRLRSLDLSGQPLLAHLPFLATLAPCLTDLQLAGCRALDARALAAQLPALSALRALNLSGVTLSAELAQALWALPALEALHLRGVRLASPAAWRPPPPVAAGAAAAAAWAGLPSLRRLDVSWADGWDDACCIDLATGLAGCGARLQRLEMPLEGAVSGRGVAAVARLTSLRHLALQGGSGMHPLNDADLAPLAALSALTHLAVSGAPLVTAAALAALRARLPALASVTLDGRGLDGLLMRPAEPAAAPRAAAGASPGDAGDGAGGPWREASVRRLYPSPGSVAGVPPLSAEAAAAAAAARRASSSSGAGAGASLAAELAARYDERLRYSRAQLEALGAAADPTATAQEVARVRRAAAAAAAADEILLSC